MLGWNSLTQDNHIKVVDFAYHCISAGLGYLFKKLFDKNISHHSNRPRSKEIPTLKPHQAITVLQ